MRIILSFVCVLVALPLALRAEETISLPAFFKNNYEVSKRDPLIASSAESTLVGGAPVGNANQIAAGNALQTLLAEIAGQLARFQQEMDRRPRRTFARGRVGAPSLAVMPAFGMRLKAQPGNNLVCGHGQSLPRFATPRQAAGAGTGPRGAALHPAERKPKRKDIR